MIHVLVVVLLLLAVASFVAAADDEDPLQTTYEIFVVDFVLYSAGGGEWNEVDVQEGTTLSLSEYAADGVPITHQIVITDREGEELWSQDLGISFEVHPYGGEHYERDEREFYWRIPYFQDAKTITVYESVQEDDVGREVVFAIDLEDELCGYDRACPGFCDGKQIDLDCTCGDGTCHDHETEENCPDDCKEGFTEYVEQATERGPGDYEASAEEDRRGVMITVSILIVLLLVGGLTVFLWKRTEIEGPGTGSG